MLSLLFWLLKEVFKVSLRTVGGLEAVMVLTLIFLKWRALLCLYTKCTTYSIQYSDFCGRFQKPGPPHMGPK